MVAPIISRIPICRGSNLRVGNGVSIGGAVTRGRGTLNLDNAVWVGTSKVLGAQQPAIADADGTLLDLTTKFNLMLAALRTHGIIDT